LVKAAEVPPISLHDTFERTPPGQRPAGGEAMIEGGGDAILVTDETAAEGRHSAKLLDAAGLSRSFYPYYVYNNLGYREGTVTNSFALRIAADTRLGFDWRDYAGGDYKTGPTFSIHDGSLRTTDGHMAALPVDTWLRFQITCAVGKEQTTWQLRVTDDTGILLARDDLPVGNPAFSRLDWIGFMSVAEHETACYIDEVQVFQLERGEE
jgi:hypothetical protein